jgi:hypothetical protein
LKHTSEDVLRAKAFLTKPFLHKTIYLIFIVCTMVAIHTFFEFAVYSDIPAVVLYLSSKFRVFYTLSLVLSMGLLALLSFNLFKLLSSSKK